MMDLPKNIVICPDVLEMSRVAAEEILRAIEQDLSNAPSFFIALSGGNTPRTLYRLLAEQPYRNRIPWERMEFFLSDERCVPYGHPDSNYQMVVENLFSRVPVPPQNIHRINAELPDPSRVAVDYENEIRKFVPISNNLPRFNLILLGMGEDGHTASLFPHSPALKETVRWVVVQEGGKYARITLTMPILNNAALILFLVAGKSKAATFKEVLEGPLRPEDLPAQMIRPSDGKLLWIIDKDAAEELSASRE